MRNPKLSYRYAKSVFSVAAERNELDKVFEEISFLAKLKTTNRDFIKLYESPIIDAHIKNKIVDTIFKDRISALSHLFLRLLITKNREQYLTEICEAFIQQYKTHNNIHTVKLTTAAALSDSLKNEILAKIKETSDFQKIDMQMVINPDIIGGFILESEDKLEDASIAYDLKQIAKQFRNNDYIYKIR